MEDEAAWLAGRIRTRTLTSARLEVAAFLGHEASRRLVQGVKLPNGLASVLKALQRRAGSGGILRAMVALTRRLDQGSTRSELQRELLNGVEAWLLDPARPMVPSPEQLTGNTGFEVAAVLCHEFATHQANVHLRDALIETAIQSLSPDECLHVVSQEVIPWSLGYRDPVAERVRRLMA